MFKNFKETMAVRAFGFLKIPLIFFCSPTVREITDERCVIRIPLMRRTKNHLGSMYFGVLAVGADLAGGAIAMRLIQKKKLPISLVFQDFKAVFLKRPESDVDFVCEDGKAIQSLIEKTLASGERENMTVKITALCPEKLGQEPAAQFELTLSLKRSQKKK